MQHYKMAAQVSPHPQYTTVTHAAPLSTPTVNHRKKSLQLMSNL
jgi:hypothetical protein